MGAAAGPDIADTGLVLALDAADFNSFKGEVTTNIVPNANVMSGWSPYSSGNDGTFTTEFGTTGYRILNRPSWNGIYQGITLPSTGTYTLSAWFRYWGGSADNNGATVYTSGGGITDVAAALDKSKVGVWQRVVMTQTYSTTSFGFYLISYGGTNAVSTWDVTMPQIEAKTYATRFTTGTRGATVATGGGWADLTGIGNNGTLVNGVRESSDNLGSLVFDGVDDYINCGTFFNYTNFTISLWVYPGSTQVQYADIFDNNHAGTQNFVCQQNSTNTNQYAFACLNATNVSSTSNFTLTANTWHYLTFTWNNSVASAYINGVFNSSGAAANPINYVSPNLSIARWSATGRHWNGRISNFVAYNRVLTATEIQQNFNATRRRFGI